MYSSNKHYLVIYEPWKAYDPTKGMQDQSSWTEHADFMNNLFREGIVKFGGPLGDGWRRVVAMKGPDRLSLTKKLNEDPWIKRGFLHISRLMEWEIRMDSFTASGSQRNYKKEDFYLVTRMFGPNWERDRKIRDQDGWTQHAAFMDSLAEKGMILLGGPVVGTDTVVLLTVAESIGSVIRSFSEDPWEKADLIKEVSVDVWKMLFDLPLKP